MRGKSTNGVSKSLSAIRAKAGRKGGFMRYAKLSKQERKRSASIAAKARWAKAKTKGATDGLDG